MSLVNYSWFVPHFMQRETFTPNDLSMQILLNDRLNWYTRVPNTDIGD